MGTPGADPHLTVRLVGGPTAILEIAGLRLITDPTFDPPGVYEPRPGVRLTKTQGPGLGPEEIGPIDAVLLSHDQHRDNLDDSGRAFLHQAPRVLTTVSGAARLGAPAEGIRIWETVELQRPDGKMLRITGVPARHGPEGSEHLTGEVIGFLLSGEDVASVYISGDNASLDAVSAIVERLGTVDVAVLFAGGAQLPYLGEQYLTLNSEAAAEAAGLLGARKVVPVHCEAWAHLSEGPEDLRTAFARAGLNDRLVLLAAGDTVTL